MATEKEKEISSNFKNDYNTIDDEGSDPPEKEEDPLSDTTKDSVNDSEEEMSKEQPSTVLSDVSGSRKIRKSSKNVSAKRPKFWKTDSGMFFKIPSFLKTQKSADDEAPETSEIKGLYTIENAFPFQCPNDSLIFKGFIMLSDSISLTSVHQISDLVKSDTYQNILDSMTSGLFKKLSLLITQEKLDFVYDVKLQPTTVAKKLFVIITGSGYTN